MTILPRCSLFLSFSLQLRQLVLLHRNNCRAFKCRLLMVVAHPDFWSSNSPSSKPNQVSTTLGGLQESIYYYKLASVLLFVGKVAYLLEWPPCLERAEPF